MGRDALRCSQFAMLSPVQIGPETKYSTEISFICNCLLASSLSWVFARTNRHRSHHLRDRLENGGSASSSTVLRRKTQPSKLTHRILCRRKGNQNSFHQLLRRRRREFQTLLFLSNSFMDSLPLQISYNTVFFHARYTVR